MAKRSGSATRTPRNPRRLTRHAAAPRRSSMTRSARAPISAGPGPAATAKPGRAENRAMRATAAGVVGPAVDRRPSSGRRRPSGRPRSGRRSTPCPVASRAAPRAVPAGTAAPCSSSRRRRPAGVRRAPRPPRRLARRRRARVPAGELSQPVAPTSSRRPTRTLLSRTVGMAAIPSSRPHPPSGPPSAADGRRTRAAGPGSQPPRYSDPSASIAPYGPTDPATRIVAPVAIALGLGMQRSPGRHGPARITLRRMSSSASARSLAVVEKSSSTSMPGSLPPSRHRRWPASKVADGRPRSRLVGRHQFVRTTAGPTGRGRGPSIPRRGRRRGSPT